MIRPAIQALPLLALAGCSLAPAYQPPATVAIPAHFREAPGWAEAKPADAQPRGDWWALFDDPVLDALERKLVVSNQNVAAARAAYQAARALVLVQRSALLPSVSGTASATRSGPFEAPPPASTGAAASHFALGIGASWEPDLWGRLGNAVSQAQAGAGASEGDLLNATLAAQGELATNYVALRGIDAQRRLLDQSITDYRRALAITTNQHRAGTVAASDVDQAQTTLSNALATRQNLDRQRATLEHAIAVLAGENPSGFALAEAGWNPVVPEVPAVVPASLLQRRPDIAAAERRVAAANAAIGVQRAAWFPQVTLSGSAGTSGVAVGQLFTAAASLWSFGIAGLATLLDFGAHKGAVLQARAQHAQAVAVYRQAVLGAFQQVEDDLAGVRVLAEVEKSRAAATLSAVRAGKAVENRYRAGTVDYGQVVVAQTTALAAQQAGIQAVVDRQTAAIALIQAIGGNWSPLPPAGL